MYQQFTKPHLFSVILLSIIFILVSLIFNNSLITMLLFTIVVASVGTANFLKIQILNEPLFPSDLSLIRNIPQLLEMISQDAVFVILSVFVGITLLVLMTIILRKTDIFNLFIHSNNSFFVRICLIVILALIFKTLSGYNIDNSFFVSLDKKINIYPEKEVVHQFRNYSRYCFSNGFLINIPGKNTVKPDNYSKSLVDAAMEEFIILADDINESRSREDFEEINIITILSESLGDPSTIPGMEVSSPLEYINSSTDKVGVGSLFSPVYGGGTPNTEYELLSSMSVGSLSRVVSTAFQSFVSSNSNIPSLFKIGDNSSRESISIHSYGSHLYKRQQVYKSLGVSKSLFEKDMYNIDPIVEGAEFVSDNAAYKEVLHYLDKATIPSNIHLVTMQNHQAYRDLFSEYNFSPESQFIDDEEDLNLIKYYMQGLYETDLSTKEFVSELNSIGKPYILFLYGDHLPSLFKDVLIDIDDFYKYQTRFFFASNLSDIDNSISIPETMSLTNVQNILMEIANVKISPYQALIREVNKEFSSIHREGIFLHGNTKPTAIENLNETQKNLLDVYQLIQYDIIDGKNFSSAYIYN